MKYLSQIIQRSLKDFQLRLCLSIILSSKIFYFALLFQLTLFWPILTEEIINDHFWPLGKFSSFPTHLFEGRWFLEILHLLYGSQGNQKTQILISIFLKSFNLLIILNLFNKKNDINSLIIGFTYLIFPTVLDQYSFYTATTFVIVETLVLSACHFLYKKENKIIAILFTTLSLAIYQPIIALIILLPLLIIIFELTLNKKINIKILIASIITIAISVVLSQIPNLFIYRYLISEPRFLGFDFSQIITQVLNTPLFTYRFFRYCFFTNTNIIFEYIPLFLFFFFFIFSFIQSKNKILTSAILFLIPFVLQSVFILSSGKANYEGRSHYIYSLFFLISGIFLFNKIPKKYTKALSILYIIVLVFFTINIQQITNYLTYKNIYDKNYINRVVSKFEPLIDLKKKYKLVIFGKVNDYWIGNNVRYSNYLPHYARSFFQPYRHVQVLNYWLGTDLFFYPDELDINKAKLIYFRSIR